MMELIKKICLEYFDYIYRNMRDARRQKQGQMIERDPQAIILDCGCREGNNTVRLTGLASARLAIGLDYNHRVLLEARNQGLQTMQADLNRILPMKESSVDVVIASDILEHLVLPDLFLQEVYRVLRPGGYVVVDTPNLASWHNIFALFLGIQPFSGPNVTNMTETDSPLITALHRKNLGKEILNRENGNEPDLARHIIVIAFGTLIRLLQRTGFHLEEIKGFGYYPFPPLLAKLFQNVDIRHSHHILIKARKN